MPSSSGARQSKRRAWERVVYVGAHTTDGNFRSRIRQHYGPLGTLGGSRGASAFRKYLDGVLLRRTDPDDPRFRDWLAEVGKLAAVEPGVSRLLRENFTFVCFPVGDKRERVALSPSWHSIHWVRRLPSGWVSTQPMRRAVRMGSGMSECPMPSH